MTQVSLYADIHGFVVDRERIATMCVAALPKTRDKFYFLPASGAELRPDGWRPAKKTCPRINGLATRWKGRRA
jgi:hypothetical protein